MFGSRWKTRHFQDIIIAMRVFQFVLGAAVATTVAAGPSGNRLQSRKSKFQFTGINESGAEFGNKALPGRLGKDYTWPAKSAIDVCHPVVRLSPRLTSVRR
jgi:hypothetical protein